MGNDDVNIGSLSTDGEISGKIVQNKDEVEKRRFFLKGKNIGISVSECEDLSLNGFAIQHLQDAIIELSRYILAVGGNLVYGGDLRKDGFSYLLYNLVQEYKDFENSADKRLFNYLSWPLSLKLTDSIKAEYANKITFVEVLPPAHLDIHNTKKYIAPENIINQIIWADCLSAMRNEMEKICYARIFFGGPSSNFKGTMPGLLEEFLNAISTHKPIYLAGAFGGMTKKICELLQNNTSVMIVEESFQTDLYFEFVNQYNQKQREEMQIDLGKIRKHIIEYGIDKVIANSGLSKFDYFQLMTEKNLTKIVYLILRGLSNRANRLGK